MIEGTDTEVARIDDLRARHASDPDHLGEWLDHDIRQLESHLEWLEALRARLMAPD